MALLRIYSNKVCLLVALLISCFGKNFGDSRAHPLTDKEKSQLIALEKHASKSNLDSSFYFKLATLYQRDQDLEKALKAFILSCELLQNTTQSDFNCEDEKQNYEKALKIYLDAQGNNVVSACEYIIDSYGPIVTKNPNYFKLAYIVSAAYANLNDFSKFFELFYHSYKNAPKDYLAEKTLAILRVKLLEKIPLNQRTDQEYTKIQGHLAEAEKFAILDYSLYKLMILYSSPEDRPLIISKAFDAIIDKNVSIPRADLSFFINSGFEFCDLEQLKYFVAHLEKHHKYSRILTTAKQQILLKQKEMLCQNPEL